MTNINGWMPKKKVLPHPIFFQNKIKQIGSNIVGLPVQYMYVVKGSSRFFNKIH